MSSWAKDRANGCRFTLADWDNDGDIDVVAGESWGSVSFFERLADGSYVERAASAPTKCRKVEPLRVLL